MDMSIQQAKSLYENEDYQAAYEMANTLFKEGVEKKEAIIICIKSFLLLLPSPLYSKENNNTICSLVRKACDEAESIEEVLNIEYDIRTTIEKWKARTVTKLLEQIATNPSMKQWKEYYPIFPEFLMLDIFVGLAARESDPITKYCNENAIDAKEFGSRYPAKEIKKVLTEDEITSMEFDTSKIVFENAKDYLLECADSNAEFLRNSLPRILERFIIAQLVVDHTIPKEKNEIWYERTLFKAEIINYTLNASVFPNGHEMSLVQGDRTSLISDLTRIYSEVKEYDDTFEEPPLPSSTTKGLPSQSSQGGCYVATAIYGSYDCPEVWTLRRFRDYTLAETWYGRAFIYAYYAISPTLVKWFGKTDWFKNLWKPTLDRMVEKLNGNGVEDTPYNDRAW